MVKKKLNGNSEILSKLDIAKITLFILLVKLNILSLRE